MMIIYSRTFYQPHLAASLPLHSYGSSKGVLTQFFTHGCSAQTSVRSAQHSVREFDRPLTYHFCTEASPQTSAVHSVSPLNKSDPKRTLYFYPVLCKYRHMSFVIPQNSQQLSQVGLLKIASLQPPPLLGFSQTLLLKRPVLLFKKFIIIFIRKIEFHRISSYCSSFSIKNILKDYYS